MLAISRHYRRWLPQITLLIFCVIITRYFYSEYKFQQKLTATILHRQDLNFDGNMGDCVMSFGVNFFGHNFLVENNYIGMPATRTFCHTLVCLASLSNSSLSTSFWAFTFASLSWLLSPKVQMELIRRKLKERLLFLQGTPASLLSNVPGFLQRILDSP